MSTTPTAGTTSDISVQNAPSWTWTTLIAVCLIIILLGWINSCRAETEARADTTKCHHADDGWKKIPAGYYRGDEGKCIQGVKPVPPPSTASVAIPRTCMGREMEVVFDGRIPTTGQSLYLCPGWRNSVRGGDITITTPNGAPLQDGPGVLNRFGLMPEGWYKFDANPTGSARELVVWSRR